MEARIAHQKYAQSRESHSEEQEPPAPYGEEATDGNERTSREWERAMYALEDGHNLGKDVDREQYRDAERCKDDERRVDERADNLTSQYLLLLELLGKVLQILVSG